MDKALFSQIVDMAKAKVGVRHDTEICRAVGISKQLFSAYREKPNSIPIPTLARICTYLNIPREERGRFLE